MKRIELYIDNNDRLTLDIFRKVEDDFYVRRVKGKACYPYIKQLCETPIVDTYEKEKSQEIILEFSRHIVNISNYEEVLNRRGTAIINYRLCDFYSKQNRKKVKPKKVTRINKFNGKTIIASALLVIMLGSVIKEVKAFDKKHYHDDDVKEDTKIENIIKKEEIKKEETEIYQEEQPIEENKSKEINISISYNDRSDTEKAFITKTWYGETLEKYAKMYGVNPNIILAIATQERGVHSEVKDRGGATGLMQIQNSVWAGESLTAYNYETGQNETITVDEKSLSDVYYNIKVGCMVFQNAMNYMDNNIIAAIQCYNMGYGNMRKILNKYSTETGKTREQILSDVTDTGWLNCRNIIKVGDKEYIENVLSWLGPEINLENVSNNGELVNLNINSANETKSISIN